MTVRELTRHLEKWVHVVIKDSVTEEILFSGNAGLSYFEDKVVGWDFSNEHIVYIETKG